METIIKGFLGCFLLLLLTFCGYGLFSASIDARNADAFLADCANRIESSDYAPGVISACQADASEAGYDLDVTGYKANGSNRKIYGQATLSYEFKVPLLQIATVRTVKTNLN